MHSIYYFNITYYCNNKCIYCFSSSTSGDLRHIRFDDFQNFLRSTELDESDMIVINGGEPTLHPKFYDIIRAFVSLSKCQIVVYSNGKNVNVNRLSSTHRIRFVIPIHGNSLIHDRITQCTNSFNDTIGTLLEFTAKNIPFSIKFIINSDVEEANYTPLDFIKTYSLMPIEILIARLNATKISRQYQVPVPNTSMLREYLRRNIEKINIWPTVKYIDIPPCLLPNEIITITQLQEPPLFYFSDDKKWLLLRNYYKQVKIGGECESCKHNNLCDIMGNTYLTLMKKDKFWYIVEE